MQSTLNKNSASRDGQSGFPPKARGNDGLMALNYGEAVKAKSLLFERVETPSTNLKNSRDWKLRLIEECNPEWDDLWFEITGTSAG